MSDILIIGAGIAGLSLAARLAPHGKVTVLEAEEAPGYHASGRSAALYEVNYGLASTVALNRASGDYLRDGGYLSPRGLMLVAPADEADAFATDRESLGLDQISVSAARDIVPILDPDTVAFAAHHDGAWDIDTDRLLQDHLRTLRTNGGELITRARVDAITRDNAGWTVRAGDQIWRAPLLINAAGAWADEVARLADVEPIGLVPKRRSMARIAAPGGHDLSRWPMMMGVNECWYAKPDAGALIISPADEDPTDPHDAWADDMVLAEGMARYEDQVSLPVTRPLATWAGLRTFAPDKALVLGCDPETPDFVWCAGQGGYGFQTSPAASQLLADLVLGRRPELPQELVAQLSPDRLRA